MRSEPDRDQGGGEQDQRHRERRSAPSSGAASRAAVELARRAVGEPLLAAHRDGPAAQLAHRRREPALRDAEPEAGQRSPRRRRPPRRPSGCRARSTHQPVSAGKAPQAAANQKSVWKRPPNSSRL